jgi:Ribosomal protein S10p/S20e
MSTFKIISGRKDILRIKSYNKKKINLFLRYFRQKSKFVLNQILFYLKGVIKLYTDVLLFNIRNNSGIQNYKYTNIYYNNVYLYLCIISRNLCSYNMFMYASSFMDSCGARLVLDTKPVFKKATNVFFKMMISVVPHNYRWNVCRAHWICSILWYAYEYNRELSLSIKINKLVKYDRLLYNTIYYYNNYRHYSVIRLHLLSMLIDRVYTRFATLPASRKEFTVLKSPHIDKRSREQFELISFTSIMQFPYFLNLENKYWLLNNKLLTGIEVSLLKSDYIQ